MGLKPIAFSSIQLDKPPCIKSVLWFGYSREETRHKKIIRSPYTNDSCGRNAGTVADNGTDLQCQHRSVSWESPILWVPTCACHVPVEDWECPPSKLMWWYRPKHGHYKLESVPSELMVQMVPNMVVWSLEIVPIKVVWWRRVSRSKYCVEVVPNIWLTQPSERERGERKQTD